MNIYPVSFKGTFSVPRASVTHKNYDRFYSKMDKYNVIAEIGDYRNEDTLYLHSPNQNDSAVMKLLTKLKIPFRPIDVSENLSTENIKSRIVMSEYDKEAGNILLEVNTRKLDNELQKDSDYYVSINNGNCSHNKIERLRRYLKTNQQINATSIYLKRNENGEIETRIKDGRHRFAVLKDMGLSSIPISISKDSIELAREINLI